MGPTTAANAPLPTDGRGFFAKLLVQILIFAERWTIRYSKVGNHPVFDTKLFPWVSDVEAAYPTIRSELMGILKRKNDLGNFQDIVTDVRAITTDNGWKTYFFTAFGVRSEKNISSCPKTWAALQSIPGLQTAMFSIFDPGKHLRPHRGPFNGVLRLHLGLVIPKGDVAIRVDKEVLHWEEGKVSIFDDSFEHEAWNRTDEVRVVLFVDFERPVRFPAYIVNKLIFNLAIFSPYIRDGIDAQRKWEDKFYPAQKTA